LPDGARQFSRVGKNYTQLEKPEAARPLRRNGMLVADPEQKQKKKTTTPRETNIENEELANPFIRSIDFFRKMATAENAFGVVFFNSRD